VVAAAFIFQPDGYNLLCRMDFSFEEGKP
jgi:hypothetical protein